MGKVILPKAITRKPGHLYYVDGKGNSIWESFQENLRCLRSCNGPWRQEEEKEIIKEI